MSELDDIRSFIAVVETGGFGRAGKSLGLSKSIVSRRIARLEEDLGTRLLSRTTRGVSPTEAGVEFKARGERILSDLAEAREAVAQQAGGVAGRLRLSMPLGFGIKHVAPVLAELAARHPGLELDVEATDRRVDLIGERFDAAIRIGTLKDSSLVARRVAPIYTSALASPDYVARHGRPASPLDLAQYECLVHSGATSPDWIFRINRRWVPVRPNGRLRSDSGETLMQWAIAGHGIVALPNFMASDAIRGGKLQHVLREYPMPEQGLFVVRPPGAYVPGKVRVLIDLLVERFGGEPYWDECHMAARGLGIDLNDPEGRERLPAAEHQPA